MKFFSKSKVVDGDLRAKPGESWGQFVLSIVAILAFRWVLFEPYVIPSGSMIPTLLVHDHILVNKFAYGVRWPFSKKWLWKRDLPKRGDIVVFRSVDKDDYFMVKRVVALPGDKIEYTPDGQLVVNDQPVERKLVDAGPDTLGGKYYGVSEADLEGQPFDRYKYFLEKPEGREYRGMQFVDKFRWKFGPQVIPEGHIFAMGDNRDNSRDGRAWGPLPVENLLGQASVVWLSCYKTLAVAPFLCDPTEIRWKRFFHIIK